MMVTVEEALQLIQEYVQPTAFHETLPVAQAMGHVLFEAVIAPISMPPFRQSAMDGYALCLNGSNTYQVIGEVKAGDHHHPVLNAGEAVRIFTGALVPDRANAVVMQEKTSLENNCLTVTAIPSLNENIRPLGEQIHQGEVALPKGTYLNPAALGFLTSLGIVEVEVYKKPSIGILVTGNELVDPGKPLPIGKIYDSNATTLSSVLKEVGFRDTKIYRSTDHFEETLHCIGEALSAHDVLFISGGISVGEYDFVGKALEALGVSKVFYKVMQKPGKPLFFGKKDGKLVFALPGNPAASLTCFYVYGQMALELFSGHIQFLHTKVQALSKTVFETKGDRAHFLKAHYEQGYVTILNGQNSSMMHTFALANALVYVPSDSNQININDTVEVILLPIK